MLGAALTVGVTPIAAKEIVYQAIPYVGLAKVFAFIHVTISATGWAAVESTYQRANS
jgi:hypothetical protein